MWGTNPYTPRKSIVSSYKHRDDTWVTWKDYALLPWWLARYAFAWLWWELQKVNTARVLSNKDRLRWLPFGNGRHIDATPIMCPYCLWAGPERWLSHGYGDDGMGDVEPVDYCPRCFDEIF